MSSASSATARRAYSSPVRTAQAAEVRARVIAAAAELFERHGWSGTSVRDIARAGGVSVETVYASVGAKSDVLQAALDVAVVGDDEPVPLADRPEFRALGEGGIEQRLHALAAFLADLHMRSARLRQVLVDAARGDDRLRALDDTNIATEWTSVRTGLRAVTGRVPTDAEVDTAFAVLGRPVFLALVDVRGWDLPRYRAWVVTTAARLLDLQEETPS